MTLQNLPKYNFVPDLDVHKKKNQAAKKTISEILKHTFQLNFIFSLL